jgi:hypothetical protein
MGFFSRLKAVVAQLNSIEARSKRVQESLGRIEARQLSELPAADIHGSEFRTFSQWGEDGILQHLLRHLPVIPKTFVEFGVENYSEANTRFLLVNDNWSGLVIDGSATNIQSIKQDDIYWRHNLKAEHAFITSENINTLIRTNGISGKIGLLSIDIDGNDYWVWEAIDVVSASIVVIEYNARFGPEKAVTVPYAADFVRSRAHYSNIYYGASLAALCQLGKRKGYDFVGCNLSGNNAFFVHSSLRPAKLPELTPAQGFVPAQFRESRDAKGMLASLTPIEEAAILDNLPLSVVP